MSKSAKLYTDGSCLGNPGYGGWAWCFVSMSEVHGPSVCDSGICVGVTTSDDMELEAVIQGLAACHARGHNVVHVYTDSMYVVGGSEWISTWSTNGWINTRTNLPVKCTERWKILSNQMDLLETVKFHWVKGHNGDPINEQADTLATAAAIEAKEMLNLDPIYETVK